MTTDLAQQNSSQNFQGYQNKTFSTTKSYYSRTIIHPKLELTEPGDSDEQEADAAANDVMSGKVCRKISGGGAGGGMAVSSQMESQLNHLQGGGQTMPSGLRGMMERGFDRDFSQVRLHTDSEAAGLSSSIHAKAFTHGNDIYFNRGQFSPETSEGQRLVAHELAHVAQGGGKVGRETTEDMENRYIGKIDVNYDNYNKKYPMVTSQQPLTQYQLQILHSSMNAAIKKLCAAYSFVDNEDLELLLGITEEAKESTPYYGKYIKEEHKNLALRILKNKDNLGKIKGNLLNICNKISEYSFENYSIVPGFANLRGMVTYGANTGGQIVLSNSVYFSENMSLDDRTYAIIHEFAHSVFRNQSEEVYMNEMFGENISDQDIMSSPDFYVLLCFLSFY